MTFGSPPTFDKDTHSISKAPYRLTTRDVETLGEGFEVSENEWDDILTDAARSVHKALKQQYSNSIIKVELNHNPKRPTRDLYDETTDEILEDLYRLAERIVNRERLTNKLKITLDTCDKQPKGIAENCLWQYIAALNLALSQGVSNA